MVTFGGKFLNLLETHNSFFRYSVARKGERECLKRKKIWQSASKSPTSLERGSETIIGITKICFADFGKWYSPFSLETGSTKEAAGPRAIRGGATPQNEKSKDFSSRWHEMKIM